MLSCWRGSLSRGSLGQGSHDDDPWALPSRIRRWCCNFYYSTVRRARCCAVHRAAVQAVVSASRETGLKTAHKGRHAEGLVRQRLGSVAQALCRPFGVPEESPVSRSILGVWPTGSIPQGPAFRGARAPQSPMTPHERTQHLRHASGGSVLERRGPGTSTRRERGSGPGSPDPRAGLKDPAGGRRRGEASSPTRKEAMTEAPARGKARGRHVSAARRPDQEGG